LKTKGPNTLGGRSYLHQRPSRDGNHPTGSARHAIQSVEFAGILARKGKGLSVLTRDHTVVAELIARGKLTTEEASVHPLRSAIARAVGVQGNIDVDGLAIELFDCDQILLCSDGLTRRASEDEI
jgi:hypothetical protein